MSKGLFDYILDSIFDSDWVGRRGEKLTEKELNLVKLFGRNGKVLRNIYVPKQNGETSEIDVVFITQKGIFVIESKNYSGWIFGDENDVKWTSVLPNKQKNSFYNPIRQNRTHIKWLGRYLGEEIPLFSLIVFSERCELKKVTVESKDIKVIKRDRIYATIRAIWESVGDALSEERVNAIYAKLQPLTNVDTATKAAHIKSINDKYKTETPKPGKESADAQKPEAAENVLICPQCGKKLVERTARKGSSAGNRFYGCSGFPQCRYTKNISG